MLLLNTAGYTLLNTFRENISNQVIINELSKTKQSEKLGQMGTL